jgi:PAS domain S-box-containing protein
MLREKNKDLNLFFNVSLDLLCVANMAGYFVRLNPAFEKILGYTIEELKAEPFLEFVHPDDRDVTKKAMSTLVSQDTLNDFNNRYRCKDGTHRWFEWRASLSGDLIYAAARDITEKIEVSLKLEERLKFETLLGELSRRFVNVSVDQIDSEINQAMQKICEHIGFDFAALWQWVPGVPGYFTMTHYYRPLPGPPFPEKWVAKDTFPWCLRELSAGRFVAVATDNLPLEASRDRALWHHYEIKSASAFPLTAGRKPLAGALSFNAIREKCSWTETLVKQLQLVAEIFANALDRKNSEEAIRESEERLSLASSSVGVGLWILDLSTNQFWATDNAFELLGLATDCLLTFDTFLNMVYPEDKKIVMEAVNRAYQLKEEISIEYRVILPDGDIRWLSSRGRRHGSRSDVADRLMGVTMDITGRKLMEGKIRMAAEEWQTTFDAIPDIVMILDKEFRIVRINAAAKSFFGIPLDEIIGKQCFDLMHGNDNPVNFCSFVKTLESKGHEEAEFHDESRDRWFHIATDPIVDADGDVGHVVHTLKDITELKKAEAEAFAARRELWKTDRIMRMGELTASLAHELNQPLTSILSNARAALRFIEADKLDTAELKEILEDISKDDKRAGDIIRSLRSMVKPDEREQERIALNDLMNETIALFHSEAIMRNIRIHTEFDDILPPIMANRVQLQQVVINMLMNATESMIDEVEKRIIVVQARAMDDNRVRVAVRDFGTGIDEQELSRIFEPFFTTKRSGLGMGLSLARSIIEAQAGRIWAENNPDGGATFCFELPVLKR